jgi:hypothetical protein
MGGGRGGAGDNYDDSKKVGASQNIISLWLQPPKLDLQSLFGLNVHSCTHWLSPAIPPLHLVSYARALLVSQERRHLFGLTTNALVNERHIKEKETECGECRLSLAVFSCAHGAQLNFDDLTRWQSHLVAISGTT